MDHPQHTASLPPSFARAWRSIGAQTHAEGLCDALLNAYAEPHRKYHSIQHLSECLRGFDAVRNLAERPAEIELALWFHDAIYDVKRSDNEEQSANWATRELEAASVPQNVVARINALVMVTRHTGVPADNDQQLLVDIDLSILGAPMERFAEYETQIRDEYAFVPGFLFRRKRKQILKSFAERSRIYGTDHFHAALEQRARENLARAIS